MGESNGPMGKNKLKNESGFTLLEVVAVLALAGLITAVITSSFLQSAFTQRQLIQRTTALILGEGKLAELLNEAELDTAAKFQEPFNNYSWSAQTEALGNGMIAVELTVKWSGGDGKPRQKIFKGITWER